MNGVNEPQVKRTSAHGTPPNESELLELVAGLQKRIEEKQAQRKQAKATHERNIDKANELRKILVQTESNLMINPYERIAEEEQQLSNQMQMLQNQLNGINSVRKNGKM